MTTETFFKDFLALTLIFFAGYALTIVG